MIMLDERFTITDIEREKVLRNYFKQGLQDHLTYFRVKKKGSTLLPKK